MSRTLDVASSLAASLTRLGGGIGVGALGPRPEQLLELYEFEACPYCRKVREVLTVLDLEALVRPCPKGGRRFRPLVRGLGGKEQFPFLVDPGAGKAMYESNDIIRHLFERYGNGGVPFLYAGGPLHDATAMLASAWRPARGLRAEPSKEPAQPLELWSFEGSPFCRLVRERLCSLEIPYRLHNVGKGSPSRPAFERRSGRMMVPYLSDPNTQVELFESADIASYLDATYGAA